MGFATAGIFNPAGEGGGLPIEAAAATAVLGVVVNVADWQYRRTKEQLEVIGGVITKIAAVAVDVAGNIWDSLNSPATPADTQGRPVGAPDPGVGSLFVGARGNGTYVLRINIGTPQERTEIMGPANRAYVVARRYENNQTFNGHTGPFTGGVALSSFSTSPTTNQLQRRPHFVGTLFGYPLEWTFQVSQENPPLYRVEHISNSGTISVVSDLDPFVGPVPGTKTPVRRKPIVTPIPTVQPATVPFPNPQPQPDREVVPPLTAPQPQRLPQTFPDQNPSSPQPATTPTTKPATFVPVVVPQVTPNTTTQTNADGSRKTAPIVGPITTPVGNEKIGPVTVTTNAPQATLAGIAGEVGRIEQKLAKMIRPPADGDLTDRLGLAGSVLKAIYEEFFTGLPSGEYILTSPCEKLPNGNRIEYEVPILATQNRFDAIFERLDALADLIQTHKDLKQPICRGTQPTGQPVTVNFTQIE